MIRSIKYLIESIFDDPDITGVYDTDYDDVSNDLSNSLKKEFVDIRFNKTDHEIYDSKLNIGEDITKWLSFGKVASKICKHMKNNNQIFDYYFKCNSDNKYFEGPDHAFVYETKERGSHTEYTDCIYDVIMNQPGYIVDQVRQLSIYASSNLVFYTQAKTGKTLNCFYTDFVNNMNPYTIKELVVVDDKHDGINAIDLSGLNTIITQETVDKLPVIMICDSASGKNKRELFKEKRFKFKFGGLWMNMQYTKFDTLETLWNFIEKIIEQGITKIEVEPMSAFLEKDGDEEFDKLEYPGERQVLFEEIVANVCHKHKIKFIWGQKSKEERVQNLAQSYLLYDIKLFDNVNDYNIITTYINETGKGKDEDGKYILYRAETEWTEKNRTRHWSLHEWKLYNSFVCKHHKCIYLDRILVNGEPVDIEH